MRISVVAVALAASALALPVAGAKASVDHETAATQRTDTVHPRSDAWEAKVLRLTNARRAAHGRRPLRASSCADSFAEPWTRHMARTEVMEHQPLEAFFSCPNTRDAGENIAMGYDTPRALVSAWMHSPDHRANMLSRHFHRIGVAGWVSAHGVTYATADFLG